MAIDQDPYVGIAYRRAFLARDPALVQVWFDASVVDKYRQSKAFTLARGDSAGRIRKEGGWTLEVGISEDGGTVHASLGDLLSILPDEELEHWATHVASLPASEKFLQMRISPGSCIDDGDARPWE